MKPNLPLGLLVAALGNTAMAAAPTPRDVAAAEALFGYDKIIAAAVERGKAHPDPRLAKLAPESRDCVQKVIADAFARKVDGSFAELFESSENIAAWVEFSRTGTGGKFIAFLQRGAAAIATGGPPPVRADFDASLGDGEKDELKTFLGTPAGAVLAKGFPSLPKGLTDAEARQLDKISLSTCNFHLDGTP